MSVEKKKKVLFVANYVDFPFEGGNSRFTYILDMLDCGKNDVELITSDFWHTKKEHRSFSKKQLANLNYKLSFIHELGYKRNISIKRLISHRILAKNLKKYLAKMENIPDVIYCAVPSLSLAKVATKYANRHNIRLIIDIQDLWPEAFKMIFNVPIISNILFYPMKRQADYIYAHADEIIAVSDTYLKRGLSVNKKVKSGYSVFLGTDLEYFDECKKKNRIQHEDDNIYLAYIGTLGHSYDIKCVIDALAILKKDGIKNVKFKVMGDGPLRKEFEEYAKDKDVDCIFMGKLPYDKMVGELCACDIAVNPIRKKSSGSIINKVGDYAAAGLPVVNTQECEEYCNLLLKYNAGIDCNNILDMVSDIRLLVTDKNKRKMMGEQNRKLAEERFDRQKQYRGIINII